MFDAHSNFGYATILVAPAPANSGTSLQVGAGEGALFPAAPFNCTVWPPGVNPLSSNAEIVRVTAVVGDVLTIDRAQEGTTAKNIAAGWAIANTTTVKVFTDIEDACVIFAGTQAATGPFRFNDGNGITFGMDNGTITASVDSNAGGVAVSAGANSLSTGTVVFANANGITFGMDAFGSITASHNGITSQTNPSASASNGVFTFQTLRFSDANFVSFGTAPGGFITASIPLPAAQSAQPVAASATNGSFSFSTLKFANAFNVTFGTSAGSIIFASVAPPVAGSIVFSAGASSASITGLTFADSNGIAFGLDNGTVTASHNGLTSQSNQAFSANGGVSNFQTLSFADGNGITFSNSNGSVMASHNGLTSQSSQVASASNGSFEFQTLGFSNANGVTFGTSNGSIITASVASGGVTLSEFYPLGKIMLQAGGLVDSVASVQQFQVPNAISFTECAFAVNQSVTMVVNNSTAGINFLVTMVILTGSAGTLNSILSTAYTTGLTVSSNTAVNVSGAFWIAVPFAGSLLPSSYWAAVRVSTANTGGIITGANTTAIAWSHSVFGMGTVVQSQLLMRPFGQATNSTHGWFTMEGLYASSNMTQMIASNMSENNSGPRACIALRFKA